VGDDTAHLDRAGYSLVVDDDFDRPELDERIWLPHYLPHWSSRAATATRYTIADGCLRLRIDPDQPPWSPEFDGQTRVSSLQTGTFSGAVGSSVGQLHFRPGLVVREEQAAERRFTPTSGLIEARFRVLDDPTTMAALWMIGFEDEPQHSAEICIAEIFGRDVRDRSARIGMGLHPFADPVIADDFERIDVELDVREFHTYSAAWEPSRVIFAVDDRVVKVSGQAPRYAMQVLLGIYEFPDGSAPPSAGPKELVVDWFRAWRRDEDAAALLD